MSAASKLIDAHDKTLNAIDLSYCAFLAVANSIADADDGRDAIQATLNASRRKLQEVLEILDALRKAEAG